MMHRNILFLGLLITLFFTKSEIKAQYSYKLSDIPFYNQNDTFDFPMAGGLNSPVFAGIDLNLDGKNDLLVLEISGDKLYPFINQGDPGEVEYSYEPSYLEVLPNDIQGWIITADYNCDSKPDLFFLEDHAVKVYENLSSTSNGFQLGNKKNITFYSHGFQEKMIYSQIYKPAIEDIDGDGDVDILYLEEAGQVKYYKNLSLEKTSTCGLDFEIRAKCWGLFTENFNTSEIQLDTCEMGKDPINERTKGAKHAGGTITAIDVDGNQTMDVLVGDVSQNHMTLLINGDVTANRTGSHIISADDDFPSYDKPIHLKSFPAAYYLDINNDNTKDLIVSSLNNDFNEPIWTENMVHYYQNTGNVVNDSFSFVKSDFLIGEMIDLGRGAHPVFYDINKDGLLDIVAGNMGRYDSIANTYIGSLSYFENVGTSFQPEFELVDADFAGLSNIKLNGSHYVSHLYPAIADLDNDGKAEMLLGDENARLHLFRDSSSNPNVVDFKLVEERFDHIGSGSRGNTIPSLYDLNNDSLPDLIIGNENVINNESGTIDFYPNWGTSTEPVFNLKVDSVIYQGGTTVRYYFEMRHDISGLSVGEVIDFNGTDVFINSGEKEILAVNTTENYVDVLSKFITPQNYINEYNTDKTAFYGIRNLGGVDIGRNKADNGTLTPFFYKYKNNTYMLSGSEKGVIYYFDSIDTHLDTFGFHLVDSNFLQHDFGRFSYLSGADINSDGKSDIIIGNQAGGFKIYYADFSESIAEKEQKSFKYKIYPNPGKGNYTLDLGDFRFNELQLNIYNTMGQKLHSKNLEASKTDLNLTNLPNGIYFVEVANEGEVVVQKIILRK